MKTADLDDMKKNYIYEYYQKINDGSIEVGKWIHLIYEYIVKGIEAKSFRFDQKKANKARDSHTRYLKRCDKREAVNNVFKIMATLKTEACQTLVGT